MQNYYRINFLALVLVLLIVGIGVWVLDRLLMVEASLQPVLIFESEFIKFEGETISACPNLEANGIEWDVTDYSYNVIDNPRSEVYRYKSNLVNNESTEIHIVRIGHGTGRITIDETPKPVVLYLESAGYSRWFIELGKTAKIAKVIVDAKTTEISFSKLKYSSMWSSIEYLLGKKITPLSSIPIHQIVKNFKCGTGTRFQVRRALRDAKRRSQYVEMLLGQRETSFQSNGGSSSYYEHTSQIPMQKYMVSDEKYALVYTPGTAIRNKYRQLTQQEKSDVELAKIRKMTRDSSTVADNSVQTISQLLDVLKPYQDKMLLPTHIPPSDIRGRKDIKWFEIQSFRQAKILNVPSSTKNSHCNALKFVAEKMLAIVGSSESNIVRCTRGNHIYVLAGGDDEVDDAWGDDLIDAGPGNDLIDTGWGADILYFGYGWGEDIVDTVCTDAKLRRKDTPSASRYFWDESWKYLNFIVFGLGVHKEDIVDLGSKLVNKKTGDSIIFKNGHRCFNFVFHD